MRGGEISGNVSSTNGGGVYVMPDQGTFTKSSTGGVITGYGSDTVNGNKVVRNGVVQSGSYHAVYIWLQTGLKNTVPASKALNSSSSSGWTE
jgi:hypothetical protein